MSYDPVPPFRRDFDAARDPYTARNALGIPEPTGGGPPAPAGAEYITGSADATLTNERVLTNTASITWDLTTPGQAKANATAGAGPFVAKAGDTMTGDLVLSYAGPVLRLEKTASGQASALLGRLGTLTRWILTLGDASPESGGNAGSNFTVLRYSDAGTFIETSLSINRANGQITLAQPLNLPGNPSSALQAAPKQYVDANFQALDADLTSWAAITRASGFDTWTATPSSANLKSLITDETGSGALVFGTSPTITTPAIVGTATNDNAAAGNVGEYVAVSVPQASAVTITGAWQNLGSISLAAGDYDVSYLGYFYNSSGTVNVTEAYISWGTTSNALDNTVGRFTSGLFGTAIPALGIASLFCGTRLSIASSGTYYANFYAAVTGGGTCKAFGVLSARRRR